MGAISQNKVECVGGWCTMYEPLCNDTMINWSEDAGICKAMGSNYSAACEQRCGDQQHLCLAKCMVACVPSFDSSMNRACACMRIQDSKKQKDIIAEGSPEM